MKINVVIESHGESLFSFPTEIASKSDLGRVLDEAIAQFRKSEEGKRGIRLCDEHMLIKFAFDKIA